MAEDTKEAPVKTGEVDVFELSAEEINAQLQERLTPPKLETPPPQETAPASQETPPQETPAETPPVLTLEDMQKELQTVKQSMEKVEKRNRDKDSFITQLQKENQTLRQSLKTTTVPPEKALERLYENPDAYIDQRLRETTMAQLRETREREQAVRSKVENFDDLKEDIAAIALEDGFPDEAVKAFKHDPWGTSDPDVILSYAKRAQDRRQTRMYLDEVSRLKAEVEKLKKAPETARTEIVQKIEQATKQNQGLTSRVGSSTGNGESDLTDDQIANMSREQLDALLKERLRREYGG